MGQACSCEKRDGADDLEIYVPASLGVQAEGAMHVEEVVLPGDDGSLKHSSDESTVCGSGTSAGPVASDAPSSHSEQCRDTAADSPGYQGAVVGNSFFEDLDNDSPVEDAVDKPRQGADRQRRRWVAERLKTLLSRRRRHSTQQEATVTAKPSPQDQHSITVHASADALPPGGHAVAQVRPFPDPTAPKQGVAPPPPEAMASAAMSPSSSLGSAVAQAQLSPDPPSSKQGSAPPPPKAIASSPVSLPSSPGNAGEASDPSCAIEACCNLLREGDVLRAERVLLDALNALEAPSVDPETRIAGIEAIVASAEYASALDWLRKFDEICPRGASGSSQPESMDGIESQWKVGAEVKINYKALGMEVSKQAAEALQNYGDTVKVLYRVSGKRIDASIDVQVPTTLTGSGTPAVLGWLAMWTEAALWETWHPVIAKGGALDLEPQGRLKKLWQLPHNVFFQKNAYMEDVRMAFDHESGALLMVLDGVPEGHPLWKEHPLPSRYGHGPFRLNISSAAFPREHVTTVRVRLSSEARVSLPDFLLKWAVSWFLPEVVKRMLGSVVGCCSSEGPYAERMREDRMGLYAECLELVRVGSALKEDQSPQGQPELDAEQPGFVRSLLAYDAKHRATTKERQPRESCGAD